MSDIFLALHFLGLAIGAGTGFYLAGLSRYADQQSDKVQAAAIMQGPGSVIANVGTIGLALLIGSGAMLAWPMLPILQWNWAFWVKMVLVGVIVGFVVLMRHLSAKAKRERNASIGQQIRRSSPWGPALSITTILFAVLAFH